MDWIPSHIGITGNETANRDATEENLIDNIEFSYISVIDILLPLELNGKNYGTNKCLKKTFIG